MRVSKRGTRLSRRSRRKTSFPLVAIVKKKNKPQYGKAEEVFAVKPLDQKRGQLEHKKAMFAKTSFLHKKSRATIDYKNVVLLRKLITGQGKILPRHITQLTAKQERYAAKAIKSARILGLLPFINKSRPV